LKTKFLHLLCSLGYAQGAKDHVVEHKGKRCNCDAPPIDPDEHPLVTFARDNHNYDAVLEDDWPCRKCAETGWLRPPRRDYFVAFRFLIQGRRYCWHQPLKLVRWRYKGTEDIETRAYKQVGKPVALPARKFAEAKSLLAFVIARLGMTGTG
jgi:hypothetical protein